MFGYQTEKEYTGNTGRDPTKWIYFRHIGSSFDNYKQTVNDETFTSISNPFDDKTMKCIVSVNLL